MERRAEGKGADCHMIVQETSVYVEECHGF